MIMTYISTITLLSLLPSMAFASVSLRSLPNVCPAPLSSCYRGASADTLVRYKSTDPESASTGACCTGCQSYHGCLAWQLVPMLHRGSACWFMNTTAIKSDSGCQSGLPFAPPPPIKRNHSHFQGTWVQHGDANPELDNVDFLYGKDIFVLWSDVETADNVWNWTAVDSALQSNVQQGLYIQTALMVGPDSPQWIYNSGVPPVKIIPQDGHSSQASIFPDYLSPKYQELFLRAEDHFATHLATLPTAITSKIVSSQAMYGSTGDDTPWHGTPAKPKQAISDEQWLNFTMSLAPAICKSFTSRGTKVLWNADIDKLDVLVKECPGSLIKTGMVSHSLQVNFEADNFQGKGTVCHTENYHCRGETWPFCTAGFFIEEPLWNTHWHLLWMLTFGVDMLGLTDINLLNTSYTPSYQLYNKYATSIKPPTEQWVGAIVALRDGLDSNDTMRFPEKSFGVATVNNQARLLAIAKNFSARGAIEGDPSSASKGAMQSRTPKSMNDVGWRVWRHNYGNGLITQLQPDATSIGWWRQGPRDQAYGRWCRSFEQSTQKNAMGFALDRRLWGGLPLTVATQPVGGLIVQVIYLDRVGKFTVNIDSIEGCKTLATITCGNSGRWQTFTQVIERVRFAGNASSCAAGPMVPAADVTLVGDQVNNIMFHSVEVFKTIQPPRWR
eukprot:m.240139 g.240139  ORF g.240139 m.240139 type:complete len:669 (-) comp33760_c3_seq1:179-2185(-)